MHTVTFFLNFFLCENENNFEIIYCDVFQIITLPGSKIISLSLDFEIHVSVFRGTVVSNGQIGSLDNCCGLTV